MRPTPVHRAIALLCLLAIGIGQSVLGSLVVRCENSSGQSTIKLACAKSLDGACLSSCAEEDSHPCPDEHDDSPRDHQRLPCKDTPLGEGSNGSKVLRRLSTTDSAPVIASPFPIPATFWPDAVLRMPDDALSSTPLAQPVARPPDSVARLRTVILTV